MKHEYEGYQGFVKGEANPFSPGSARAAWWDKGWLEAQRDIGQYEKAQKIAKLKAELEAST